MAVLFRLGLMMRGIVHIIGEAALRSEPFIALLFHFPRLGLAALQARVGAKKNRHIYAARLHAYAAMRIYMQISNITLTPALGLN